MESIIFMNYVLILTAMIFIWTGAVVDIYQHLVTMPKWFSSAPAHFHSISKQINKAKALGVPLSIMILLTICIDIVLNWKDLFVRNYLIASAVCFILAGFLSLTYFAKQVLAFTKVQPREALTPELYYRMGLWFYKTTARDLLQVMAAIFVTMAFAHF